jgi:hypothetical protein
MLKFTVVVQIRPAGRLRSGFDEREPAMSKLKDIDWLFNGRHFEREVIVLCVRWYLRYKLSFCRAQSVAGAHDGHALGQSLHARV